MSGGPVAGSTPPSQATAHEEVRSVAGRAVRGSLWAAVGAYATFAINFAGVAVLARYVSPAEFGSFALAMAYSQVLAAIGLFPFAQSVVQSPRVPAIADTALVMAVVLRTALLVLAIPVALVVSRRNGTTVAILFVELVALDLLDGARGSMAAVLQRDLHYRGLSLINVVAALIAATVSVWAATLGFGAHALLLREVVLCAVVLGVYVAMGRRWGLPSGRSFHPVIARRVWAFAKGLFWVRSLEQVLGRVDRVVLGNALGLETLGLFHQARYLATLPQAAIAPANMQVAIATYSKLRDDTVRLGRAFDMVQYVVVRVVPLTGLVFALYAEEILRALYGQRWLGAAPALGVLAIYAVLGPIFESYRSFSVAMEEWRPLRRSVIAQGVLLVTALFLLAPRFGAVGAAWATCLGLVAGLVTLAPVVARRIRGSDHGSVRPVGAAVAVALAAGWWIHRVVGAGRPPVLVLAVAATCGIYGLVLLLVERRGLLDRVRYLRTRAAS